MPGQPTVDDIVQAVLKECRKENLKYKMVALRCAAGLLQATQEDRFQELADIVFPIIKKVTVQLLEFSSFKTKHSSGGSWADAVMYKPHTQPDPWG